MEPYKYALDNDSIINLISVSIPIIENNKLIGFSGCDALTSDITKMISDISFFENDYACFITHKGNYATNPAQKLVGAHISTEVFDEQALQSFKNGQAFHSSHISTLLNTEVFDFYIPLKFKDYNKTWYLRLSAPMHIIYDKVDAYRARLLIIISIALLMIIVVAFFISYYSIKPLSKISQNILNLATKGASGAKTLSFKTKDEIATLSKSYNSLIDSLTEKEQLEQELKKSQAEVQAVFDNAPIIMLLVDHEHKVRKINQTGADITGIDVNTALGMTKGQLFNCKKMLETDTPCGSASFCNLCPVRKMVTDTFVNKKGVYNREGSIEIKKNGKTQTLQLLMFSSYLFADTDEPRVLVSLHDITLQKVQEEKLQKSEQLAKMSLSLSNSGTWYMDFVNYPDRFFVTPELKKIQGIVLPKGIDYMMGDAWQNNILNANKEAAVHAIELFSKALENPDVRYDATWQFTRDTDAKVIWIRAIAYIERDSEGNVLSVIGVNQDITKQIEQQEEIRKNEERYSFLLNNINDTVWGAKVHKSLTFTTPQMPLRRGFTVEEVMAQKPEETFHPNSLPIFENTLSAQLKMIENGDPKGWETFSMELQESTKAGGYLWTQMTAKIVPDDKGKPKEIIGTTRDISERKRQEKEIQKSKEQLQTVFDSTPIIMMLVSRDGRVQNINETGAQMTGIKANDAVGLMGGKLFNCIHDVCGNKGCHKEEECHFCDVSNAVEETYASGNNIYKHPGKLTIVNNSKSITMSLIMSTTLLEQDGEKIVLIGLDDVTLQKQQEEQLTKYKTAIESSNEAIGIANMQGKATFINKAFAKMFEYSFEEVEGLEPHTVYADKSIAQQMMGTIMQGDSWQGEVEMLTKRGRDAY